MLKAAIARIDEQLGEARANAARIDERHREYDELEGLLRDLPEKLTHPIMVPFGPLASFEGHLQHTNEVLVQLSSEWFVLRTTKHALGTVDRRRARLNADKADVAKEMEELSKRRELTCGERSHLVEPADVPGMPGASVHVDKDGFFDIREPLLEDDDASAPTRSELRSEAAPLPRAGPAVKSKSTMDRLRELEAMEENEDLDEMEELDRIANAAEHTHDPSADAASAMAELEATADAATSGAPICSPADIFRLMNCVDDAAMHAAGGGAASIAASADVAETTPLDKEIRGRTLQQASMAPAVASPPATGRQAMAGGSKTPAGDSKGRGQAAEPGAPGVLDPAFSGLIREHAAAPTASTDVAAGSAPSPVRVSKFKADRQRARG